MYDLSSKIGQPLTQLLHQEELSCEHADAPFAVEDGGCQRIDPGGGMRRGCIVLGRLDQKGGIGRSRVVAVLQAFSLGRNLRRDLVKKLRQPVVAQRVRLA